MLDAPNQPKFGIVINKFSFVPRAKLFTNRYNVELNLDIKIKLL